MKSTISGDAAPISRDATKLAAKLRVDVCDSLARKKGVTSVEGQARLFGIHRSHMWRMRGGGRTASIAMAMSMAELLGTTVEELFELIPARADQ